MNGRVQVPELALTQGHNRLNLSGEMPLPEPGVEWWQTEFDLNIAAKIDNLTELSALMLPDFQYTAGKVNIDGSIRGKDQQFHGQLIIAGSDLRWHNAPIEELHAGVKLNGNEFQITNVSLFNNGDYLRGHGVVNILGDKQYWGEFHASIEDLAKYSALLQKPIVPEPLAGGAVIDWTGEGSAKGHSGQFSARLRKLRSLGATAALLHPINADFEGNYAPGMMQFSRFMLSDDDSSFTANVGIGNKALSLQGIRLYNKQALWLEGDALLPLDVWNAWPNTSLATLLDDQTVSKVNLTAYNLELRDASLLTGWKFPIQGVVRGNVVAEGPLGGLKTSGKVSLSKAQIPIGWSGELLTVVESEVALDGQTLQIAKFTGLHPTGDFSANGQVDFTNLRDPSLQLEVTTAKSTIGFWNKSVAATTVTASGKLQVTGPMSKATVAGDVQISALDMNSALEAATYSLLNGNAGAPLPPVFVFSEKPWNDWKFDIALHSAGAAVGLKPPTRHTLFSSLMADTDLRLRGSGGAPEFIGSVTIHRSSDQAAISHSSMENSPVELENARIEFREGYALDPSLDLQFNGSALEKDFAAHATGTLQHPIHFLIFEPPLNEKIILAELAGGHPANVWGGRPARAVGSRGVLRRGGRRGLGKHPNRTRGTTGSAHSAHPTRSDRNTCSPRAHSSTCTTDRSPGRPAPCGGGTGSNPTCARTNRTTCTTSHEMSKGDAPGRSTGLFIGRYFGIAFYLDASWFLIAAIVTYELAFDMFPREVPGHSPAIYLLLGITAALLFFLSILLHELGHSLVSQRCGIRVPRITLLFVGGLAEISREPDDAKTELKIALGGPAVSVFLSGLFYFLQVAAAALNWGPVAHVCGWLAWTNLALVVFNMFPGYPLDGGRVLRAVLWAKSGRLRWATYVSSRIGIGFSWLLIVAGVAILVLPPHNWGGLSFLLIGFFLKSAAESGYANAIQREILGGVRVRDLMTANPATILDSLPLNLAVEDYFLSGHHVAYPVCTPDGEFRGLLRLDFLKEVPKEKWPYVTAGDVVAEKSAESLRIGVNESAARAMRLLLAPELSRLAVIENDRLVGIVTRHDILHFIEIHMELED
ncbi:MAG: translocation/assembly module TamB domain-containing protein [Chthoniobacter sp.]